MYFNIALEMNTCLYAWRETRIFYDLVFFSNSIFEIGITVG